MKAVIDTKEFMAALRKVMLAANAKQVTTTQISNAIKMDVAYDGVMTFTAYNFTVAVETVVMPEEYDEGSVCVNAKTLIDIISKCVNPLVTINADEQTCTVKNGKAVFSMQSTSSDSFATLPQTGDIKPVKVDGNELVESANSVLYAAATSDKKPALMGVSVEIGESSVDLVACDSYRLAKTTIEAESGRKISIIVPCETISILAKVLKDEEDNEAEVFASNSFIIVKTATTKVTSRLIAGTYLDWKNTIPKQKAISCVFDKKEILREIEMAQTLQTTSTKGVNAPIVFDIQGDTANVSLQTASGKFEDQIDFETNGCLKLGIAFNPRFLEDAIKSVNSDEVELLIIGALSPCIVKEKDNDKSMNMVLPVRIKQGGNNETA